LISRGKDKALRVEQLIDLASIVPQVISSKLLEKLGEEITQLFYYSLCLWINFSSQPLLKDQLLKTIVKRMILSSK